MAKNTFPTLQTLRQGLRNRRHARFRVKNARKVAVISETVDSIPQKMLLASKRAYECKPFLVNCGPAHLRPLKGTTKESQRFVSHVLYRQVLVHFSIRHLPDKTTPMALGSIRKHQHLAARTRVVQCNGMRHKILRVRPSLQPSLRPRGYRYCDGQPDELPGHHC